MAQTEGTEKAKALERKPTQHATGRTKAFLWQEQSEPGKLD